MSTTVLTCSDIEINALRKLLQRFGLGMKMIADDAPITGTWFGEPEAGLVGHDIIVRRDTPIHSALHESCHFICMDESRRANLHTNAGGDYDEENGVNYLQILLADYLPGVGRDRMLADMDTWGYTYRLGSARAWFEQDAEDARDWLLQYGIIRPDNTPRWRVRQS